ncbi:hypothetical protein EIP91_007154 [Steccherinum ochraceum]|uniref:DUF6699 domain-containing protein n=1 Tax=Steccherinum ochraceum TaxID=92696 RepID=A0A4R0RLU8_9APHY|nr:hypothetical protein EIP91_007154 [Steccherinum ochraceum]
MVWQQAASDDDHSVGCHSHQCGWSPQSHYSSSIFGVLENYESPPPIPPPRWTPPASWTTVHPTPRSHVSQSRASYSPSTPRSNPSVQAHGPSIQLLVPQSRVTHRTHRPYPRPQRPHDPWPTWHYSQQTLHDAHIRRMARDIMPYEPHPSTGHHPTASFQDQTSLETYRITGGWPLPGLAPAEFSLRWPREPMTGVPILLSPCLIPNPLHHDRPVIDWDMSQLPSTAKKISDRSGRTKSALGNQLDLPATNPPCTHMSIVCSFGSLGCRWGPISIQRNVVTVWDVLDCIYEFLYTPMHPSEVYDIECTQEALNLPPSARLAAVSSSRLKRSPDISARPKTLYRRVDCLGDRRYFWGMWISFVEGGGWYLNLGTQEKYRAPPRRTVTFSPSSL